MLIKVNSQRCCGCDECWAVCPRGAIALREGKAQIDMQQCVCCGACIRECPMEAIAIAETDDTEDNE
mgnify:FL=1